MLRTCPRCGDFYADASLLFCLADGTPLFDVDPHSESWAEGARVVEEKERARRIRTRRLRLRRVMTMTTTMLITTAVIFVIAVQIYVHVAPNPDEPVVAVALTPSPTPRRREVPEWTPTPDTTSTTPFVPAVTPTPTPSATPTPRTPTPTPTPQQCTEHDKQRVEDSILAVSRAKWEGAVKNEEHDRIERENLPDGAVRTSVTIPEPFHYSFTFSKTCAPISVRATYTWVVKWGDSKKMAGGEKHVDGTKTYTCGKDGDGWRCG